MTPVETKDRYLNRELSALAFNERVLEEGMTPSLPLLERLKFLGIVSSTWMSFSWSEWRAWPPAIRLAVPPASRPRRLFKRQEGYFVETMVPEMEKAGLLRLTPEACDAAQMDYLRKHFLREILPVLTPSGFSDEHALPTCPICGCT